MLCAITLMNKWRKKPLRSHKLERGSYRPGAPAMTCGVGGGVAWHRCRWGLCSWCCLIITAPEAGDESDLIIAWGSRTRAWLRTWVWLWPGTKKIEKTVARNIIINTWCTLLLKIWGRNFNLQYRGLLPHPSPIGPEILSGWVKV